MDIKKEIIQKIADERHRLEEDERRRLEELKKEERRHLEELKQNWLEDDQLANLKMAANYEAMEPLFVELREGIGEKYFGFLLGPAFSIIYFPIAPENWPDDYPKIPYGPWTVGFDDGEHHIVRPSVPGTYYIKDDFDQKLVARFDSPQKCIEFVIEEIAPIIARCELYSRSYWSEAFRFA